LANLEVALKKELVKQLRGGNAHAKFEDVTAQLSPELRGKKVEGLPYTAWQLLEHIRIAQKDMLDYCRNHDGGYKEKKWPDDYWPKTPAPADQKSWDDSLRQYLSDREEFISLVEDPKADLVTPFPWGEGQTLLHEAMLIVDHAGYHLGEIVAVRRLLGTWK
jgi:hypothetical protein